MKRDWLAKTASEEMDSTAASQIISYGIDQALEVIKGDPSILSVGCGDGTEMELWRERLNTTVFGIDLNDASLEKCLHKGLNVEKMDMHDLSFDTGSFGLVFARDVFEHSLNHVQVLSEFSRVSSKYVVIVLPDETWQSSTWHFIIPTLKQMISLGEKSGLKLVALREYNLIVGRAVIEQVMYVFEK